ncbi:pyridoxamine 5'-phosphate oxidase family protein [Loktanella sp. SALINAS62]|uniref:pyridoxamine 5'-phosphate oxidase family protein n=1 Tax=Loktanella sp. SALINAS62 TaxID=2706124 RepID=UPI001B8CB408|nr:pyridoxamine 5'-phosphate oxidase family protein [Loktanella sp. SALINAS62]MBS1301093.1 pyridoxamine 5'-phosphate oxidase family protein [Loktanella sp. SALINAS62]
MSDAKQDFWDRVDDVQAGMLGLGKNDKLVPMSPTLRKERDGKIWFIAAAGETLVENTTGAPQDARFVIADGKSGLYANIDGTLKLHDDKKVLDEIWNFVASAWFEDDKQDPDVRLLCFEPTTAACWFSTTSAVRFFYEIAKANATDSEPDQGYQADLTF